MRCIECSCCKKGWFPSRPDAHVCIGTPEPFVIDNVHAKYTEYNYWEDGNETLSIADAISHFKYGVTHDIFKEPVTTYAKMAIEALEKQIPKKPIYVDTRFRNHGRSIADGSSLDKCYKCPNCQSHIFHVFDSEAHCKYCGQLLDWE